MRRSWDIFCSVVDNYGDIGVCWRLARILSNELDQSVRLWVDDLASFGRLCPDVDPTRLSQCLYQVEIRKWQKDLAGIAPADIVVEGFGVRLPADYVARMAERSPHPVWINLEYLSAEAWVDGCHGLPSPHATLPLIRHFFFPGFTPASGGLLIERALAQRREAFQGDPRAIEAFWKSLNVAPPAAGTLRVSLFCYQNAALESLVDFWSAGEDPVECVVPAGAALNALSRIAGCPVAPGSSATLGKLVLHAIPFLELDQYDRLLWACDLNFVRGEDSFVRAQLAARPLVWQAYPQSGAAHLTKVSAFLARYAENLEPDCARAVAEFWSAWNGGGAGVATPWQAMRSRRHVLAEHARAWAQRLTRGGNLAAKLADFCENKLK